MAVDLVPLGKGSAGARPMARAFGVGSAGVNALSRLPLESVAVCNALDAAGAGIRRLAFTDADLLALRSTSPKVLNSWNSGPTARMAEAVKGVDLALMFAGLGGDTGSYLAPMLAGHARKAGALTISSVTMPFSVEGEQRRAMAAKALPEVAAASDLTIVYPNDGLLDLVPDVPLMKAFRIMDSIMAMPALDLTSVLTREDIRALKEECPRLGHMRMGMGQGVGLRKEEVAVTDLLTSPWLKGLRDFEMAILIISGSLVDDVTVREVVSRLKPMMPDARIHYAGISDPAAGDRLRVTLLVAGPRAPY